MQITKKFLESANWEDIEAHLEEALNQKVFIESIFSPKSTINKGYLVEKIIYETLWQFPDKFLSLPPEFFVNSIFKIDTYRWNSIRSGEVPDKEVIEQILPSIESVISLKHDRFDIFLDYSSFLLKIEKDLSAKIIEKLIDCCNLTMNGEFLSVLGLLPQKSFKRVIDNSIIKYEYDHKKWFDQLPKNRRQLLLEAMVDDKAINFGYILSSKNVSKKFFDENADILMNYFGGFYGKWVFDDIFNSEAAGKFKQKPSRFVLLAALKCPEFATHLASGTIEEYARKLKSTQRTALASLLGNEAIAKFPPLLARALKAHCGLKNPPSPMFGLNIPDEVISKLSSKHLETLVNRGIDQWGDFQHLKFNPILIARGLTSVAISRPSYYEKEIAGKLSLAIEKYKNGESSCEKICRHLGFGVKPKDANEDVFERAIRRAAGAETVEKRYLYVSFIADMLRKRSFVEIQRKYKELLEKAEKKGE